MLRDNLSIVDAYMNECMAKGGTPGQFRRYFERRTKYDSCLFDDKEYLYDFNPYARVGLQCLAKIFMFNPRKIDKGMIAFNKIPAEQRVLPSLGIEDVFYAMAEELARNPAACRKNILDWIDKSVDDGFKSFEKQDLPCALKNAVVFKRRYSHCPPNMFCNVKLSTCLQQFCAVMLVYSDKENITFPIIWDDDVNRLSMQEWNLFCYIVANAKFKISIRFKLSDDALPSTNKLIALRSACANSFKNKSVPTLSELATFTLLFKSCARLTVEDSEQGNRNFVDIKTHGSVIRQEVASGFMDELQQQVQKGTGRLTITM